jgi:nicotinate phosphoribosyltransferase
MYGIGTRLITSAGDAALDGVFKLVAVRDGGDWLPAIKLSETKAKTLNPGTKRVWRVYDSRGYATADVISTADETLRDDARLVLRHPTDEGRSRVLEGHDISRLESLLVDVVVAGRQVGDTPSIEDMRTIRKADLVSLDPGVKRLMHPHLYHVSLTQRLWDFKQGLVRDLRARSEERSDES